MAARLPPKLYSYDGSVEYDLEQTDRTHALLRALIRQIELGSYTDDHGHKLTNNVHFIKAKEAVGE